MKPVLKPSEVLQRVKESLPSGYIPEEDDNDDNSPYICDNIMQLWREGYLTDETKVVLKNHISNLLEGRFCLKDWLYMKRITSPAEFQADYYESCNKLQQTRQLWLDDMIKHFQAKGM